jgi:hypothetical protein
MARYPEPKLFKPKSPEKYAGDPKGIVYRSSWEFKLFAYLDNHSDVLNWASEEFFIPYYCPVTRKQRRYFPDVLARFKQRDGTIKTVLIEVKPESQTLPPSKPTDKRKLRRFIKESATFQVNMAKFNAAREYCSAKGWHFVVMTEKQLFSKKSA